MYEDFAKSRAKKSLENDVDNLSSSEETQETKKKKNSGSTHIFQVWYQTNNDAVTSKHAIRLLNTKQGSGLQVVMKHPILNVFELALLLTF